LAYGQTGSGKTFTLFGSKSKGEKGLVDYMIEDIIDFATSKKLKVECSFMQIYK
jgi:type II secretory ATPase GspE/PulE/Tfp pilus assembly ATPase PilB-like protein